MRLELTAVHRKVQDGSVAWVEEYPGALTQADTLDEARANLDDAVRLMIETSREMHAPQTEDGTAHPRAAADHRLMQIPPATRGLSPGTGH